MQTRTTQGYIPVHKLSGIYMYTISFISIL